MGFGSSMMLKINIEKVLKELGIADAEVEHCDLNSLSGVKSDLIIVSKDLVENCKPYGEVMSLSNIMKKDELKAKLEAFLNNRSASQK